MSNTREALLTRVIHKYGMEATETIVFATYCERDSWTDDQLARLCEYLESLPID